MGPDHFDLDFTPYAQFVETLLPTNFTPEVCTDEAKGAHSLRRTELLTQALEICYLTAWAKENGIVCPPDVVEKFIRRWEESQKIRDQEAWLKAINMTQKTYLSVLAEWSLCSWLIEKQPHYFGYVSWSLKIALIKELQITGQAARFVEKSCRDAGQWNP